MLYKCSVICNVDWVRHFLFSMKPSNIARLYVGIFWNCLLTCIVHDTWSWKTIFVKDSLKMIYLILLLFIFCCTLYLIHYLHTFSWSALTNPCTWIHNCGDESLNNFSNFYLFLHWFWTLKLYLADIFFNILNWAINHMHAYLICRYDSRNSILEWSILLIDNSNRR